MLLRIIVWVIMIFGGAFGGFFLDGILFKNIHSNLILHIISFIFGIFLLLFVLRVSKNTGRTLARLGREGDVKRMDTNKIVREGIYGYMRHPMHLGLLFFPVAIAFMIGSPSFILIIAPVEIIMMLIAIKFVEEKEALSKFGKEYEDYKSAVPAFCFSVSCLKALLEDVPKNIKKT